MKGRSGREARPEKGVGFLAALEGARALVPLLRGGGRMAGASASNAYAAAIVVAMAAAAPAPASAQTEQVVTDEVTCPDCEITLTHVATLGKLEDDVALNMISQFALGPEGPIYAGQTYLPGTIVMYDREGDLVSTFGRVGQGPGEFSTMQIGFHIGLDDAGNLHIVDSGRRTIIRPELSELVRVHSLPIRFDDIAILDDGSLLGSASTLQMQREAEQFVLMDSLGSEVRRFGTMPADPQSVVFVARASEGGIWASYQTRHRFESYSSDGSLERILQRDAEWWDMGEERRTFYSPTLGRVSQDGEGRLWTIIKVPAADRERAEAVLGDGEVRLDQLDRGTVYDTRVELLDPENGTVVATAYFEEALTPLDHGYVAHDVSTPEGLVQSVISSLTLVRPDGDAPAGR